MKVGDLIMVKPTHWVDGGKIGIILEDKFSGPNRGKAWNVLFANGKIKTKLAKHLEVLK